MLWVGYLLVVWLLAISLIYIFYGELLFSQSKWFLEKYCFENTVACNQSLNHEALVNLKTTIDLKIINFDLFSFCFFSL